MTWAAGLAQRLDRLLTPWGGKEGVTGYFPLEWVAPHEERTGARERLFPPSR